MILILGLALMIVYGAVCIIVLKKAEHNEAEVIRATIMREKTLQITEKLQAEIEKLERIEAIGTKTIETQNAEIERLQKQINNADDHCRDFMEITKIATIKEFAERLKAKMRNCSMYCIDEQTYYLISYSLVDNLVKEMTEGKEDEGK